MPKDHKRKRSAPPKLLKRYTFQELSANAYAVDLFDFDMAGEAVLSPATQATFIFQTQTSRSEVTSATELDIDLTSLD